MKTKTFIIKFMNLLCLVIFLIVILFILVITFVILNK